jgi:ribokinase
MAKPIVTVVGSFAVGMTIRTDHMPIFGETLIGSDFDMGPGGKGSNQAVGTARMGAESHFAGIIGDDKLGEIAVDMYRREGVHTDHLERSREMATGVGFIILNQAGENGIILDMSANKLMDEAFVDRAEAQIARSAVVMSVLEIPVPAAARAMLLGRRHGVLTLLNPAPAAALADGILENCDIVTPNETELRVLLGLAPDDPTSTLELAHRLHARGPQTIIVTMGERGALVLAPGREPEQVEGLCVDVIDTTGAGDAFNSGLAVALSEGRDLITAVRFANCAGALACTALGVIPAMARRAEVVALYATSYGTYE